MSAGSYQENTSKEATFYRRVKWSLVNTWGNCGSKARQEGLDWDGKRVAKSQ